jgi:hypothetical protein
VLGYVGYNGPRQRCVGGWEKLIERKQVFFEPRNVEALSSFLNENKGCYHEIWVILTKKEFADPQPVSFDEAVREAIKHGLVDSKTKTLSEKKYGIRFTKRRPTPK